MTNHVHNSADCTVHVSKVKKPVTEEKNWTMFSVVAVLRNLLRMESLNMLQEIIKIEWKEYISRIH